MDRIPRIPHVPHTLRATALATALALGAGTGAAFADTRANNPASGAASDRNAASAVHDMRLSKLIGMDVGNSAGKEIGEIRDIVVDANNGQVRYAVVEHGGFLGMGQDFYTYPLSKFRVGDQRGDLVLNVSEEQLKKSPGFKRDQWPDWNKSDYGGNVDRYYGETGRAQSAGYVRGSKLLDADLRAKGGEDIGNVEDVVVNVSNGKVSYVVVEFDPGWITPGKLVALPMRAFDPVRDRGLFGDDLLLNVDKSRVQNAPAFARDQWPDESLFRGDVDRYSKGMGWGNVYGPTAPVDRAGNPQTRN